MNPTDKNLQADGTGCPIVLFSGGFDSSLLVLHNVLKNPRPGNILAVSYNYGQRHGFRELDAGGRVLDLIFKHTGYRVLREVIDLRNLEDIFAGSALTDRFREVPHGHYAAPNMNLTVVPNRNMVMLSLAMSLAVKYGYQRVAYAAHAGDHPVYGDCRPDFTDAIDSAFNVVSDGDVALSTPFIHGTKGELLGKVWNEWFEYAKSEGFIQPWEQFKDLLQLTYSCYEGGDIHCGACGTCIERRLAFMEAALVDPTAYKPEGLEQFPDQLIMAPDWNGTDTAEEAAQRDIEQEMDRFESEELPGLISNQVADADIAQFTIRKSFTFEAAHELPHHRGKCSQLHGHSYTLTVELRGAKIDHTTDGIPNSQHGMLTDYGDISAVLDPYIIQNLDHKFLNKSLNLISPTAEAIAYHVYQDLKTSTLAKLLWAVEIQETASSMARYEPKRPEFYIIGREAPVSLKFAGRGPIQASVGKLSDAQVIEKAKPVVMFARQRFALLNEENAPITLQNEEDLIELLCDYEKYKQVKEAAASE